MARGDVAARQILACAQALRKLASIPAKSSPKAADAIRGLLLGQFASGKDPYGRAWKPLADSTIRRKGNSQINVDRGHLRDDMTVRPKVGAGIEVIFPQDYAQFVQRVRPLLPAGALPKVWAAAIERILTEAATRVGVDAGAKGRP